jgi:hypothetical protein
MIYREQGMSHALLTADLTTVPSSFVGVWTLIFGIEPKNHPMLLQLSRPRKISYIDQGKFRP